MAAVTSSAVAMRVVAGSAASGSRRATLSAKPSLARGVATLKSVKMGKASGRGALVVSAVRVSLSRGVRRGTQWRASSGGGRILMWRGVLTRLKTARRGDARRRGLRGGTSGEGGWLGEKDENNLPPCSCMHVGSGSIRFSRRDQIAVNSARLSDDGGVALPRVRSVVDVATSY